MAFPRSRALVEAAVERRGRARGRAAAPEDEDPSGRLSRHARAFGVERSLQPLGAHISSDAEQRSAVAAELDLVDAALAERLPRCRRCGLDPRAGAAQAVRDLTEANVTGAVGVPDRSE